MLQNTVVAPGSVSNVIWPPFDERANASGPLPAVIRRPGDSADDQVHQHVTAVPLEHPCNLLLPSTAARNLHLVPPGQLDTSINRHASLQKQLRAFSSSFQDAYVPHDVLLPLLLEDMSDTSIRASKALAGNCTAGCTVFSSNQEQHLTFNTCGQIGEQLLLTVLESDKYAMGADTESHQLQTVTTTQINLGKEILQVDIQPYSSQNPQLRQFPTETAADVDNRDGQSAGLWVLARSMYRVDVLWAGCKHHAANPLTGRTLTGRAAADNISSRDWQLEWRGSVHLPCPAAHVKMHPTLPELLVLMNDGNVGVVSLAPCSSIQSSQLAAPIPLNCSLLFSPDVLSRTKSSSGMQAGSTLQDNKVTMTCTWGMQPRTILLALQGSLWRCDVRIDAQGLPCSQPTSLNQLPGSDVYLSIARLQRSRHGCAKASHPNHSNDMTAGTSQQQANPSSQQQPAAVPATSTRNNAGQEQEACQQQRNQDAFIAQTLLPYMAALTSTQIMLIDLRRPQSHVIATPHACTSYPPMYLNVTALHQIVHSPSQQQQQSSKDPPDAGGVHGVQTSASLQGNTGSQQADVRLGHPSQPRASNHSLPVQATGQESSDVSQQQASSVDVLLTWGTAQGAVYSWQLAVRPSSVQLALGQQANSMLAPNTSSLTDTVASQLVVCHVARSFGQAQHASSPQTTAIAGLSSQLLLASWQPACFEVVQAVGLVRQLCQPNSLKNDARLKRLRKQRAYMYSQDETRQSNDGLDSSHSAVLAFEARYWGHQSDVLSRRAELIKSHLQASEHVPDLQGLAVLPLWHAQAAQGTPPLPAALLLRSSFDGDLAVQHLQYDMSTATQSVAQPTFSSMAALGSPAALPPHVTIKNGMKVINSEAAAAPLQTGELTIIQPATTELTLPELSSQLARRYTSASHAARMLLGPQQGLLTPSSPRLRAHYHSCMQLLQAMCSSQALPVGGLVGLLPQQQHRARDNGRVASSMLGQQQGNGKSRANQDHVPRHNWQLVPRQPTHHVLRIPSIAATGIQEGVRSSSISHLLKHDSLWQKAVRDMVLSTGSTMTVGDVLLRLSRAVGKAQTAATEQQPSHTAKRRKTQSKQHATHSLLAPGPYDQTVAVKQGSQKGYVEQILQNSVQVAVNSLRGAQPHTQPAEKKPDGRKLDKKAGNDESSQNDKASLPTQPTYGVLACCKTPSKLLADAQALQGCLQAGVAGSTAVTEQEVMVGTEHEPYSFLQSAITVRSHSPRRESGQQLATGTARTAPLQGGQRHDNVQIYSNHHSSDLTKAMLALHGTIIVRYQLLRPTTSQVAKADVSASPVEQRQEQFNKQFTGTWRIEMPQAALDIYHQLLDAWPEGPCAAPHEKTQPPSAQETASRDARFFVPGYQRDAAPSSPQPSVHVGGKAHDSMPAGAEPVRDGVGRSQGLPTLRQTAVRPAQRLGAGVDLQVQMPTTQTQVSVQPSSLVGMEASAQLPTAQITGSAPLQSGGVTTDMQASQPQPQSQTRPQLSAAARAALLERKRKAASRAAEGF